MKVTRRSRFNYVVASSLLAVGAGVLGYAPVRALFVGAGTGSAVVVATGETPAPPPATAAVDPAPDPGTARGVVPDAGLPVEDAMLASPPHVPPPIMRDHPARVVVNLEVRELIKRLADGVTYDFWTFGGTVPGSFIRVREGDLVEFHLNNAPGNKMPHNIDLHAVTGPGGGATASFTAPGHSSVFSFTALNPGLFVYHCAMAPVGMHIADGMYGLILVQPRAGLPKVDHEYYVMQGEVYTTGDFGAPGLQTFDLAKALDERPPYVVFNGAVGALTGANALTARVGDTVRLYFGNGGPNLDSAFHVIGEQFDTLYEDGTMKDVLHDVQTTLVPPGSAVIVDFKVRVPGTYTLVDHSIFRAFNKGALGQLTVIGPEDPRIYSGKQADELYPVAGPGPAAPVTTTAAVPPVAVSVAPADMSPMARGRAVFMRTCFACHQPNGEGLANVFPPLAGSDFLAANHERPIRIVTNGLSGPVTVQGHAYNNVMPPQQLSDEDAAAVLTYVTQAWGNHGRAYTVDDVRRVRADMAVNKK